VRFPQGGFEEQPSIPAQVVAVVLEVAHEYGNQRGPVNVDRYTKMAINAVDTFITVMKGVPQFGRMMPGGKSINETGTDAALKIAHRIAAGDFAVLKHFLTREVAPQIYFVSSNTA
jgi:hypothetical protein